MKKLFLSIVIAIVAVTATFAQSTVATLTHGDNVTMFYGGYALRDAHNAAVSGDVINLSGGVFQAITITKAVTLRGSGIDAQEPTFIVNDIDINIPDTDTGRFSMEGIRCSNNVNLKGTLTNAVFLKCFFVEVKNNNSNSNIKNAMFADCKVRDTFRLVQGKNSIQFANCFVGGFDNVSNNSTVSFLNCIVNPYNNVPGNISHSQLTNCILYGDVYVSYSLPNSTIASNCVSIYYSQLFAGSQSNTGCKKAKYEELFKTFKGSYSDAETFELTDEAKATFLGIDGTEVGLYGGVLPYTSTPSYPHITKMNVANRTTNDGKLSVEIEVSDAK